MSIMCLVRCIEERETNPMQLTKGKLYWIDDSTRYKDGDGTEYVQVYLDEEKTKYVGNLSKSHFKNVYRYLRYGLSLFGSDCADTGHLLEDIIYYCVHNTNCVDANAVLRYIQDNKLDTAENWHKEYIVKHVPFKEFEKSGKGADYQQYFGYYLYCVSE